MTERRDPVEEVLDSFFDHLEGGGAEPSLDHLTPDERAEAEQLIGSIKAARGVDPSASRPSIAALIARGDERTRQSSARSVGEYLEAGLRGAGHPAAAVEGDTTAMAAGFASRYVVHVRGLRVRVIVEAGATDVDAVYAERLSAIAAVFGAFPDTNAALLMALGDAVWSAAIIDRDDVVPAVETPSGQLRAPRIRRPICEPVDACLAYVSEVMPTFEAFDHVASRVGSDALLVDVAGLAAQALDEVVAAGHRATGGVKQSTWIGIGPAEADQVADELRRAIDGDFDEARLRARIEELSGAA
ncbi:MAG TPA: hypothetical protein VNE62_07105 [Actinomycetota bacterium]|nr:hypothetical protein [Actinomycetota bacterium]